MFSTPAEEYRKAMASAQTAADRETAQAVFYMDSATVFNAVGYGNSAEGQKVLGDHFAAQRRARRAERIQKIKKFFGK